MNRLLAIVFDWLCCQLGFTGDFSRFAFDADQVPLLAVAIQRTSPCTAHAGIAYRTASGALRFIHFANHEMLRDDRCSGQYAFAAPLLKEEDLKFLAEFCARVYRSNQSGKLPYGFSFDPNLGFDRDTGLIALNQNSGLTCSTFVVALFRSAGNPLVTPITWPRRAGESDIAAREYVLDMWRKSGKLKLVARADEIETTIQTMRISPEQVAGACLQKHLPTGYYRAGQTGNESCNGSPPDSLRKLLDTAHGSSLAPNCSIRIASSATRELPARGSASASWTAVSTVPG